MVLVSNFLMHLFCAAFNCDYENPSPTPASNIAQYVASTQVPIVYTQVGAIQGFTEKVSSGRDIFAFEGIPYAEPPIEDLRFKPPVPKKAWNGILQALSHGHDCLQFHPSKLLRVSGNEDCLFLNIYTPNISSPSDQNPTNNDNHNEDKLPVIIWIHGGNFFFGAGREYGPYFLLKENVILVTVNYRLGVLGFMSTGDDASPGNYGIKDQALAIKFIHDNIASFGGDKTRITIMGQSAGAVGVHLHMLSSTSVAKGLFRNGISLSGSAFLNWALKTAANGRKMTNKLAKAVGCPTNTGSKEVVTCLKNINPYFLVGAQLRLFDIFLFPVVLFGPVIEPSTATNIAYINDTAENYYARNEVPKIPWICTNTQEEGEYVLLALSNVMLLLPYKLRWQYYFPIIIDIQPNKKVMDEILKNYLGNTPPEAADSKSIAAIGTDRYFQLGNRRALRHHYKIAPTYSYIFGFTSNSGVTSSLSDDYRKWGASHGEDMSILFNSTTYFKAPQKGDPLFEISNIVISLIFNFASKGEPLYTDTSGHDVTIWEPIRDPKNLTFLRLNYGEIKMIPDPFKERLKVWDELGIY